MLMFIAAWYLYFFSHDLHAQIILMVIEICSENHSNIGLRHYSFSWLSIYSLHKCRNSLILKKAIVKRYHHIVLVSVLVRHNSDQWFLFHYLTYMSVYEMGDKSSIKWQWIDKGARKKRIVNFSKCKDDQRDIRRQTRTEHELYITDDRGRGKSGWMRWCLRVDKPSREGGWDLA